MHMFTRSSLRVLGKNSPRQLRRPYSNGSRNDIRLPGISASNSFGPRGDRNIQMMPHPYSEAPQSSSSEPTSAPGTGSGSGSRSASTNESASSSSSESNDPSSESAPSSSSNGDNPPPPNEPPSQSTSSPSDPPPEPDAKSISLVLSTNKSSPSSRPSSSSEEDEPHTRLVNPFNTHQIFQRLERDFPSPVAHTLMRSIRGLLIDRTMKARREGVDQKEAENQEYLYKAALSELRTELTMRTKNESTALQQGAAALQNDIEALRARMKEDVATMKHEMQMEFNNRKNEVKGEAKLTDIAIEELVHKATVNVSDLKTEVEQVKWDNTRRGVLVILSLVAFLIISTELAPKPKPKPKKRKQDDDDDDDEGKKKLSSKAVQVVPDLRSFEESDNEERFGEVQGGEGSNGGQDGGVPR